MRIGNKGVHRQRAWGDDDYLEGLSECLSEPGNAVGDVYDTLICHTCQEGQVCKVWHAGLERLIQVVLLFDKYRCTSCGITRWNFNHFRGFTASTFVLYAVSWTLILFFGITTLGILLDRQSDTRSAPQFSTADDAEPTASGVQYGNTVAVSNSEVVQGTAGLVIARAAAGGTTAEELIPGINNLTTVFADPTDKSASRFDQIVDNPLSNTLFEPMDEAREAVDNGQREAGVILLPAAFRITFVPDRATPVELADQGSDHDLGINSALLSDQNLIADHIELDVGAEVIQETPVDIAIGDIQIIAVANNAVLDQYINTAASSSDAGVVESAPSAMGSDISANKGLELAISGDGNTWLFGQPTAGFTAQLGSFNSLVAANNFVSGNDLAISKAHVLETVSNDKTWFYVLYDSFELQGDAEVAVHGLGLSEPWIRKFGGLQAKRCATWQNNDENAFNTHCR
ncbi:MAG: hypothetical protein P8J68_03285 [Arenicellaceae bacterium]|nr:hypothetical protein [Arenicellaceae bacterium]